MTDSAWNVGGKSETPDDVLQERGARLKAEAAQITLAQQLAGAHEALAKARDEALEDARVNCELVERLRHGNTYTVMAAAKEAAAALEARDGWVMVPREPTEDQWSGLARDIMMWLDMEPKTPRALFEHLDAIGTGVPPWLRVEPEMKNLDSVPSKGTRCVILYRAMLAAAPAGGKPSSTT